MSDGDVTYIAALEALGHEFGANGVCVHCRACDDRNCCPQVTDPCTEKAPMQ